MIGPTGVFVIDSKQWTGSVHQSADGLVWHNHYRLDRTLATVRWEAETLGRLLGTRAAPLLCVHGAHVQGGGLHAQGVAIVPASLLRSALGHDRVLSDVDVDGARRHRPDPPAPCRLSVREPDSTGAYRTHTLWLKPRNRSTQTTGPARAPARWRPAPVE